MKFFTEQEIGKATVNTTTFEKQEAQEKVEMDMGRENRQQNKSEIEINEFWEIVRPIFFYTLKVLCEILLNDLRLYYKKEKRNGKCKRIYNLYREYIIVLLWFTEEKFEELFQNIYRIFRIYKWFGFWMKWICFWKWKRIS